MSMGGHVEAEAGEREGLVDLGVEAPVGDVGGKATALGRAMRAGARVPPGFVVTTRCSARGVDLARAIEAKLAALGDGPFAVRSSAAFEDGAARSFAGQLETELGVPREGVADAVERCLASASSLRALRYGAREGAIAVVVQTLVPASAAGVAFSADPSTGEREVVLVEAVAGLGDRLVSGEVDPERWRVTDTASERTRRGEADVLSSEEAAAIHELARRMEALFGAPQDVEWALAGGALHLLQSRPITALPAPPIPIPIDPPPGSWERDDHHAVLSPLGWAWFQPYPVAMARAMNDAGLPLEGVEATRIGGHLYLRFVTGGGDGARVPPRWVLWLVSRLVPAMRRGDRAARRVLDGETFMDALATWEKEWRPALKRATDGAFVADPTHLSDEELLAKIDEALAIAAEGLDRHARLGTAGMLGVGKLILFAVDHLGWTVERVLGLVAGSSEATTALHREVEALVARHHAALDGGPFPPTWAALARRCPELAGELSAWLEDNRLRMLHYDPKHPMLGERPDFVLSIAEGAARALAQPEAPPRAPPHAASSEAAALDEAEAKLGRSGRAEMERQLANAKRLHALRDENGVETVSRPAGLLRHFVLELGRRLGGAIETPEHAVYLEPSEHGLALRGALPDVAARIARRRGEESWAHRNRGPRNHGPKPAALPPLDAFPSGLGRVFRIMGLIMESERTPEEDPGGALCGVGIGSARVTGRARVVLRPDELAQLRHGEIVVCRITSPEWSVGLGRVAALVTEEGGLLSHPAIIAREYGVTAVLGAEGAMRRIATGDRITVDPAAGTVTVAAR